jgi:hypothetical protein
MPRPEDTWAACTVVPISFETLSGMPAAQQVFQQMTMFVATNN